MKTVKTDDDESKEKPESILVFELRPLIVHFPRFTFKIAISCQIKNLKAIESQF
jgi:hypothetical protein